LVRGIIGTLLVFAGLLALLVAVIAAIVALVQLARRREERAQNAGAVALAGILAMVAGVGIGGAILPAAPPTEPQGTGRSRAAEEAQQEPPTEETTPPEPVAVLDAGGVVAELEDRGLYCTELGEGLTRCEQGDPTVGSHGYMVMVTPGSGSVERIQANVFGYTPADVGFLSEIAALKIRKGVDTEAARRWVMAHAEGAVISPASKKFGGLAYSIEGGATEGGSETRILIVEEAWY
jgi:hypothetical protein